MSPNRTCRRIAGFAISLGAVVCLSAPALADQTYSIDGRDSFTVGTREARGDVVYTGRETLTSVRGNDGTRFVVTVDYVRLDQGARAKVHGRFVSLVTPSGEQRDEIDGDRDYVTVLNQPFSVALDLATMRDIARTASPAPFSFALPLTSSPLVGSLKSCGDGLVAGERTLGVAFDAEGPVHGPLGNVGISLDGRIHMHGTAYYSQESNVLRAVDTNLTITGFLTGDRDRSPVTIVYRRRIRAVPPTPLREARRLGGN